MCTAISLDNRFFGRTLDYERSFGEKLLITPRECAVFGDAKNRYAIMGVGVNEKGLPLYFDGVNEWGLAAAALEFKGYAVYHSLEGAKAEIASGGLVSFLLGFCRNTDEVKGVLSNLSITADGDSSPLHWIIADKRGAITVESTSEGLKIYDNPVGVLTNSPEFPFHLTRLAEYSYLRADPPENHLTKTAIKSYSRGMGAIGLPGDFSSSSRFVRAVFLKNNAKVGEEEKGEASLVSRFFHIAEGLSVPCGCVITDEGRPVSTRYTVCADLEDLTYYFTTEGCRRIRALKLTDPLFNGRQIKEFPLYCAEDILPLN